MTKITKYREAIRLRSLGKSYSQIKRDLYLSKSTLSRWLKNLPLSKEQINNLRGNSQQRIEKFRNTMRKKREEKLKRYYLDQKDRLLPLTEKELFLSGLFLYWGEGNKATRSTVSINNTDPDVLKFTLYWYTKILKIQKKQIKVFVHLYNDMDITKELKFWSSTLNISLRNFDKPYIKKSKKNNLDQKGFGHGTCGLRISDTVVKDNILVALDVISDAYGKNP